MVSNLTGLENYDKEKKKVYDTDKYIESRLRNWNTYNQILSSEEPILLAY